MSTQIYKKAIIIMSLKLETLRAGDDWINCVLRTYVYGAKIVLVSIAMRIDILSNLTLTYRVEVPQMPKGACASFFVINYELIALENPRVEEVQWCSKVKIDTFYV